MKEKPCSSLEEDTEDMRILRGISQGEMDQCWKKLAERMDEEVLDKYKVEDSKREAYKGRGGPLEWRRVRRSRKYRIRKWRILLGKNLRLVQRVQHAASAKQAGGVNGRRREEAAAKNEDYEGVDEENQIKRKKGR